MVELAHAFVFQVDVWDLPTKKVHEVTARSNIAVSVEFDHMGKRWAFAHRIPHCRFQDTGEHVRLGVHALLHHRYGLS